MATPIVKNFNSSQNLLQEKSVPIIQKLHGSKPNIILFPAEAEPEKIQLSGTEETNSL
jgi:hypothetical protein